MASQDFLFRIRRRASLVAFNTVLPANFKLIVNPGSGWVTLPGVNLDPIASLELKAGVYDVDGSVITPPVLSSDLHYNLRVTDAWSGWAGLFIDEGDPDYTDPKLDKSKLKRWMKNNGIERLDTAAEHPRSGRTDMRWFRWTDGTEWVDITISTLLYQRRVWL